jgi:ketosteroid isomerase-like protein
MRQQSAIGPARSPEALHAILEDAFNLGDLDAYVDAFEPEATLVVPPDGRVVHGHDDIRAASDPIVSLRPRATIEVRHKLEADGLALTRAHWHLVATDPAGDPLELDGNGTIVSRRQPDATWRIVIDDPLGRR